MIPEPGRRTVAVVLAALMALAGVLLLVGLTRDLPSPEPDEPFFVLPAVRMATHDSVNPRWFGHPGSTVIVPLAIAYRAREVLFHGAPVFGDAASVERRYREDPGSFYLLGRIWTALLTLATVPLVYFVGRRILSSFAGLLGAAAWVVLPLVLDYGRLVRTDAAATCFGLLALLAALRALERPSTARFAAAGALAGLAVATRWFMVTVLVAVVGAWWCTRRDTSWGRWWGRLAIAGGAALGAFAVITPAFFYDWAAVQRSVLAEDAGHFTNVSPGPLENLTFYLFHALPDVLSWPGYVLAVAGIAVVIARRRAPGVIVVAFVTAFLLALVPASLHWQRWLIPVLPCLALFAAGAVCAGAAALAQMSASRGARDPRRLFVGAVAVGMLAVTAVSVVTSSFDSYAATVPTTRTAMRDDVRRLVPRGDAVALEVKGPSLGDLGYRTYHAFDLPRNGTVADYAAHGYHYFVVNTYVALQYRLQPERWPEQTAFYTFLRWHGRLLGDERPGGDRQGPHLKLYRVDDTELLRHVGRPVRPTTLRSSHDRVGRPSHEYPGGGRLFDQPA